MYGKMQESFALIYMSAIRSQHPVIFTFWDSSGLTLGSGYSMMAARWQTFCPEFPQGSPATFHGGCNSWRLWHPLLLIWKEVFHFSMVVCVSVTEKLCHRCPQETLPSKSTLSPCAHPSLPLPHPVILWLLHNWGWICRQTKLGSFSVKSPGSGPGAEESTGSHVRGAGFASERRRIGADTSVGNSVEWKLGLVEWRELSPVFPAGSGRMEPSPTSEGLQAHEAQGKNPCPWTKISLRQKEDWGRQLSQQLHGAETGCVEWTRLSPAFPAGSGRMEPSPTSEGLQAHKAQGRQATAPSSCTHTRAEATGPALLGSLPQQDPGVPSEWTVLANERERETRPECAAESGSCFIFHRSHYTLSWYISKGVIHIQT